MTVVEHAIVISDIIVVDRQPSFYDFRGIKFLCQMVPFPVDGHIYLAEKTVVVTMKVLRIVHTSCHQKIKI